ncbi:MAG: sigma-70 family RNA polymerase sigma factor [Lachnospiraceae bacterium]|nr:sigma-70 family RNA polymerase sigma factor [Lachnospiraceae bacterium]
MKEKSLCADDLAMIEKYSNMVYRMAYSMVKNPQDAEDIHQDVFVKYIGKRPVFESENHAKAWFLRVTINTAKNLWKTAWKQKVVSLVDYDLEEQAAPMQKEDSLIQVVKQLPQKYRTVIHLFYYEELSVEEIATLLKAKPSTVRTQLTRARSRLKELLKEDTDVSGGL